MHILLFSSCLYFNDVYAYANGGVMAYRSVLGALALTIVSLTAVFAIGCGGDDSDLTIYSGRSEALVGPLLDQFSEDTGINVRVRYGGTTELAGTILEEGSNSPADVFIAQDAGALGAVMAKGRFVPLPEDLLAKVPEPFRSPDSLWVGLSGRARVIAYNTDRIDPEVDLPNSILDFTDKKWANRIGWAPANGSFQAFVTALRLIEGDAAALDWLEGIKSNEPIDYPKNTALVDAVAKGEVDVGFTNHYYLFRFLAEQGEDFSARNYNLAGNDAGALINIAGAGILDTSDNQEDARQFIEYMLSPTAQQYFADETFEYPLVEGVEIDERLRPLSDLEPPNIDLSDMSDLDNTLDMLREAKVLP